MAKSILVGRTVDDLEETLLENIHLIDTTSIERKELQIEMVDLLKDILDKLKDIEEVLEGD